MWTARDSVPDRPAGAGAGTVPVGRRESRARVPGRLVASLGIALAGSAMWAVSCPAVRVATYVACGVRGRRRSPSSVRGVSLRKRFHIHDV